MSEDLISFTAWIKEHVGEDNQLGYVARRIVNDKTLGDGMEQAFRDYLAYHSHYWLGRKEE